MITLRPYQTDIIEQTRALLRSGSRSVLIQAPTGSGKTALASRMLHTAASRGHGAWFVCHRRELVTQSAITFAAAGVDHGIVAAGFDGNRKCPVQICSVMTLARRWHNLARPRLIVWDEAHHVAAASWSAIHKQFPEAVHIGLTATPQRLDGTGLGEWFQEIVCGPSVRELIDQGFLADYRLFAPSTMNTAGVHSKYGDYVKSELSKVADKPRITGDAIQHYQKYCNGAQALAFCVSIEHSQHVAEQFRASGISAEHVDGETPMQERDAAMARFKRRETRVLTNVELFGEGVDVAGIECVIGLRPTQSLAMYLQQCGRGLRVAPNKPYAVFLDHAGNCRMHGLPDDPREWSLLGTAKAKGARDPDDVKVKQCPMCYATVAAYKPSCRHCGHVFVPVGREIETVAGELSEVDIQQQRQRKRQEQWGAQTEEELVRIGELRRYARPRAWARHIIMARHSKRRIAA